MTIKQIDNKKNKLVLKAEKMAATRKKLYSNIDISKPMTEKEKKLTSEISKIWSEVNKLIGEKRKLLKK